MSDNKSFDFNSFVAANEGQHVTGFDYLHTLYKSHGLAADFVLYFTKLFWPDFKVIDGLVYLSEMFEPERYRSLLDEGRKSTEAQYWMNLLEITGLFDELPTDDAMFIAEALAASWNSKMIIEFGSTLMPARAIRDIETDEIFVTIGTTD